MTITNTDTPHGSLTVAQTSADNLGLSAEVHFLAGTAKYYDGDSHEDAGNPVFTTWGKVVADVASVDGNDENNTTLITGYKANSAAQVTYKALGASVGWLYIPIDAYIEDTTDVSGMSEAEKTEHTAIWKQAIQDATTGYTASVKYTYTNADSSGALLLGSEVFFYKVDESNHATPASMPTSYVKASESDGATRSTTGVSFSVSAKDLSPSYIGTEASHASVYRVGYLVVRVDGAAGVRNHSTAITYTAQITATASI